MNFVIEEIKVKVLFWCCRVRAEERWLQARCCEVLVTQKEVGDK